jgi:hypothetical protein
LGSRDVGWEIGDSKLGPHGFVVSENLEEDVEWESSWKVLNRCESLCQVSSR